ncbi:MAG: hypothetical protein RLZZ210_1035 [Pseudomonadota bacterium]|jgi:type IV secretion system protein VirD4
MSNTANQGNKPNSISYFIYYPFTLFLIYIYIYIVDYVSGILNILQYGLLPWNIDSSEKSLYKFSNYVLTWWHGNIPNDLNKQITWLYFKGLAFSLIGVSIILLALYLYLKAYFFNSNQIKKSHGDAKFADVLDIINAGLLPKNANKTIADKLMNQAFKPSILLGKFNDKFLEFRDAKFVALAAPTRAGKGVGIVIPNLLHWQSSVVCLDIKGENFDKTSGYRSTFTKVYKFDPFSLETHKFNPLSTVSRDPYKTISDIQTIARILWPINDKDPIWNDSSCNLFQGLVLYLLDNEKYVDNQVTMANVFQLANDIGTFNLEIWNKFVNMNQIELSTKTQTALSSYFSLPQETRTSVLGTFLAQMQVFSNPTVEFATSGDDFKLEDIRKEKISIYVCIAPNRLSQASKLLNIFFSQLIQLNTEELPEQNAELIETALILLDEFTALGKVDIIEKAISYIAGYNLRLLLIYQSQSQLSSVYGEDSARNIVTNCGCQILFAPREQKDAEEYSKILGNTTINIENYSYNRGGKDQSGKNISINQQERALMLPQEIKEMGKDVEIIILEDCKPIKANKIKYYEDSTFISRIYKAFYVKV